MQQVQTILHSLLSTVGSMFRRIAIGFGSVFLVSLVAVEGIATALTSKFPPTGLTHVVAVVIGFSLALNVAFAVAIEEGLRGLVKIIEDLIKGAERAAIAIEKEVTKEGGEVLGLVRTEATRALHGSEHLLQNAEHGAATLARDAIHLPGEAVSAVEGGFQAIERKVTGQDHPPAQS